MKENKGRIHLYTGEGEGKTITAFGLALRALGHGHKVVIVQFMKGRKNIGEYKIKERLAPEYEIHQFGKEGFIDFKNPGEEDFKLAEEGLEFAKKALKRKPDMLILDEINLAVAMGLLKLEGVMELLDKAPKKTVVILTGRRAPKELIERADLATEMKLIRHPMEEGIPAREGVEY